MRDLGSRAAMRVGSSPFRRTNSSQALYRLRRVFYAPHQKLISRLFFCFSFPNRIRCADVVGFAALRMRCTPGVPLDSASCGSNKFAAAYVRIFKFEIESGRQQNAAVSRSENQWKNLLIPRTESPNEHLRPVVSLGHIAHANLRVANVY